MICVCVFFSDTNAINLDAGGPDIKLDLVGTSLKVKKVKKRKVGNSYSIMLCYFSKYYLCLKS